MLRAMAISLREQHAQATRERILAAVADLLERDTLEELTVPAVAEASGVSLRTVYRYYPTREELLEAAGRWIGNELMRHPYPQTLDEVAAAYRVGVGEFAERPGLVRALALSHLGERSAASAVGSGSRRAAKRRGQRPPRPARGRVGA